jgi:hypothetical protein
MLTRDSEPPQFRNVWGDNAIKIHCIAAGANWSAQCNLTKFFDNVMKIRNFKMSPTRLMLFIALVALFVVAWFLNKTSWQDKIVSLRGRPELSVDADARLVVDNLKKQKGKEQRDSPQTIRSSAIDLRTQITNKLQINERFRYQLLHLKEQVGNVTYMVQVEPPSIEEIKDIRATIGAAQRSLDGNHAEKEEFDKWIDDAIADYDCLGFSGHKIVMITIPDDPKGKISAYSYHCNDPNAELTAFKTQEVRKITGDNVRFYVGYAGDDNIKRFQKLIQ